MSRVVPGIDDTMAASLKAEIKHNDQHQTQFWKIVLKLLTDYEFETWLCMYWPQLPGANVHQSGTNFLGP